MNQSDKKKAILQLRIMFVPVITTSVNDSTHFNYYVQEGF